MSGKTDPESKVREIRRKTRRKFSAEEKIRIVLEGLRGEDSIAELCRREGISPNLSTGQRSSSRPASGVCRAIRSARPRAPRSGISVRRMRT
jgi:transposase